MGQFYKIFDEQVVFKIKNFGAAGDNVRDDTQALKNAIAACNEAPRGGIIELEAGAYKITSGLGTVNPEKVTIRGSGGVNTAIDGWNLSSGPMMTIQKATSVNYVTTPLQNLTLVGPPGTSSTVDAIILGGAGGSSGAYGNHVTFRDVNFDNFRRHITYGNNTWCTTFDKCNFRSPNQSCIYYPSGLTNSGENLNFNACTFMGGTQETIDLVGGPAGIFFSQCSFDYAGRFIRSVGGGNISLSQCHLEADDGKIATGASEIILMDRSGSFAPQRLVIKDSVMFPFWTTATRTAIIRLTGSNGAMNVTVDGMHINTAAASPQPLGFVVDDSAGSYATLANFNYSNKAGTYAVDWGPYYFEDKDNVKHYVDITPVREPRKYLSDTSWLRSHTSSRRIETFPRVLAKDSFQVTSGTIYFVAVKPEHTFYMSSALVGCEVAGTSLTTGRVASYEFNPATDTLGLAGAASNNPTGFQSSGIISNAFSSALGLQEDRLDGSRITYLAVLFIGTTMPFIRGISYSAPNTLLGPVDTTVSEMIGFKYTGQTTFPGSVAQGSVVATDFIPWIGALQ